MGAVSVIRVLLFVLQRECEGTRVTVMLVWGSVVVVSSGYEYVGGNRGSGLCPAPLTC